MRVSIFIGTLLCIPHHRHLLTDYVLKQCPGILPVEQVSLCVRAKRSDSNLTFFYSCLLSRAEHISAVDFESETKRFQIIIVGDSMMGKTTAMKCLLLSLRMDLEKLQLIFAKVDTMTVEEARAFHREMREKLNAEDIRIFELAQMSLAQRIHRPSR